MYTISVGSYDLEKDRGQHGHGWTDLNDGDFCVDLGLFHGIHDEKPEDAFLAMPAPPCEQVQEEDECDQANERRPTGAQGKEYDILSSSLAEDVPGSPVADSGDDGASHDKDRTEQSVSPTQGVNQGKQTGSVDREKTTYEQKIGEDRHVVQGNGRGDGFGQICQSNGMQRDSHDNLGFDPSDRDSEKVAEEQAGGPTGMEDKEDGPYQGHTTSDCVSSKPLGICKIMIEWPITVFCKYK
jgi:hypothetical protein